MKNLYLLPTDKPSRLCYRNYRFVNESRITKSSNVDFYHLYIISDEIPTEGDALMRTDISRVFCTLKGANPSIAQKYCRKIILTTDPSLVGVQQIDEDFLKWFVQNPKREWVEVKKDYLAGYYIPQKQETLEEAAKNSDKSKCKHFRREDTKIEVYDSFEDGFVAGAKWQSERMYSQEEVLHILFELSCNNDREEVKEWFSQFKKEL